MFRRKGSTPEKAVKQPYRDERLYALTPTHTLKLLCTRMSLHPNVFTFEHPYNRTSLKPNAFKPEHLYTRTSLKLNTFTLEHLCS